MCHVVGGSACVLRDGPRRADGPRRQVSSAMAKLDGGCFMVTRYAVAVSLFALAAVACSDSNSPKVDAQVSAQDQCDPASFNAALGDGTCTKQGTVTLTAFNNELNSTHQVASWQFVPSNLTIRPDVSS